MSFKSKHKFEKRKDEAHRILQKYPERIPVICEKDPRSRDIPDIDRKNILFQLICQLLTSCMSFASGSRSHLKSLYIFLLIIL